MDTFLQRIFGGSAPPAAQSSVASVEDDFADFAGAPDPTPVSIFPDTGSNPSVPSAAPTLGVGTLPRPFTKWYRVWERVYLSDFYAELFILPFIIVIVALHVWGTNKNRRKAKGWLAAHGPVLQQEFSSVGFNGQPSASLNFSTNDSKIPTDILREKSAYEFLAYATGRQNVAFVDIKLTLAKRYNPMSRLAEQTLGFFVESMPAPKERMEATCFVFDGRETSLVPAVVESKEKFNSSYDGFVWGIVHKESMKTLRDGRYDLSLTSTRDHAKLPVWASVMSESAEITETLLTPELLKAIESAGEALEALIISDQSIDQPRTLNEAQPKKRISLALRLPRGIDMAAHAPTVPLFQYFLRTADTLASNRFRPEVMRRVKATREEEMRKIRKADEGEKAEERRQKMEKDKKKERDDKLKALSPEQQRKFLEKERAQDMRKAQKSRTMRG